MAKKPVTMIVDDLTKVYGTNVPLLVTLLDNNTPLANKEVYFTINGVKYIRTTNDAGIARLNINLVIGEYITTVQSFTDETYSQTTKTITVKVTDKKTPNLVAENFTKVYGTKDELEVGLYDNNIALIDKEVYFTINGVTYTRNTNNQGIAKLKINLNIGIYYVTITTFNDDTYVSVIKDIVVTVLDKKYIYLQVNDLVKTYGESAPLKAKISYENKPLSNKEIYFAINGITYTRRTNDNGEANLNINLIPGEYPTVVKTFTDDDFNSTTKNVTVIIKKDTKIEGRDLSKKYLESAQYVCKLLDVYGNALPNQDIELTVNGVTYIRKTDNIGNASLNIKLNPEVYNIYVSYKGDKLNNPSTTTNTITVKKDIEEVTVTNDDGTTESINNRGFAQTNIYCLRLNYEQMKQYSDENKGNVPTYFLPNWDLAIRESAKIRFTSYEIKETDPRVRTAKITTPAYYDLTKGQTWFYITNPNYENFAGQVIKVDYDGTTGLYTYQLQDGRRQYQNKRRLIVEDSKKIYDVLKDLLLSPVLTMKNVKYDVNETAKIFPELVSGLHKLEDYKIKPSPVIKALNQFDQPCPEILSYDSDMDKIMSLAHYGGEPTDVWFDTRGVCHIDPIDLDVWLNTGIKFVHQDLVSHKKSFDITNILTGVTIKDPKSSDATNKYNQWKNLGLFFGANIGVVDPVTVSTNDGTNSTNSSGSNDPSGIMKGKKTFAVGTDNISGYSSDIARVNKVIDALKAKGHNAYSLGVGPSVNQNHGLKSASKGVIDIFIVGGVCAGTTKDFVDGMTRGYYHYDRMIMVFTNCTTDNWISCKALKNKKQVRAWDDGFSSGIDTSITPHEMFERNSNRISYIAGEPNESFDSLVNKLVNGQFNCGGGGGTVSNTSSTTSGEVQSAGTTVIDEDATYEKAIQEMSKSVRNLLSFEMKVPLNNPIFKQLHTNMMIWTELPNKFNLENLEQVFKILPTYKVNRGISYMVNRWYVEELTIKEDNNGLFGTIKVNPFPSEYSTYSNAIKGYVDAYNQAFKQQTTGTATTSSSGGVGEARLGNDSAETGSMACATGRYRGHAGDNENFDSCAKKGYAKEGKAYYSWARQYKTPIELAKALANRFSYSYYYNNQKSVDTCHNNGGTIHCNCYDACRLVKVCFDACGFDCIVVTGSIYQGGHGWNAVKHNGRWYSFDLCYASTGREWAGTNSLRLCNEW